MVELGVARGIFSEELLKNSTGFLYSIDSWEGRGHNDREYQSCIERLRPYKDRNSILRMRFDQALSQFEDGFFDLVYIDGYAHEGENGAINNWWPKVKVGGVYAGHDYSKTWPLVIKAVDELAEKVNKKVHIIPPEKGNYVFPSWAIIK